MVIQNFDTFFLRWDDNHKEVYFPRERMSNRKIKYLIVLNGLLYGNRTISPSGDICTDIRVSSINPNHNDIVNLFDNEDRQILSQFALSQLRFLQEDNNGLLANPLFKLSSAINPSLSYIRMGESRSVEVGYNSEVVPVCVVWDDDADEPQRSLLRCKTFDINTDDTRINISDITSYFLADKKVRKIEIAGKNSDGTFEQGKCITDKFITIKTKDGKQINDFPSLFLATYGHCYDSYYQYEEVMNFRQVDDISFDSLDIAEDLSYIDNPSGSTFNARITFYY